MKKYLIVIFLLLCAVTLCFAFGVTDAKKAVIARKNAGCPVLADGNTYNQNFENTGEPASWSNSNSPDYDYALPGSPAAKLCDEGLRVTSTGETEKYAVYDLGSQLDGACVRVYFYIASATLPSNYDYFHILEMGNNATPDTAPSGILQLYKNGSGNIVIRVKGDGGADTDNSTTLTIPAWHYVDICFDADNAGGDFYVDGVDYTGSFDPYNVDPRYLILGYFKHCEADEGIDITWDAVAIGTDEGGVIGQ